MYWSKNIQEAAEEAQKVDKWCPKPLVSTNAKRRIMETAEEWEIENGPVTSENEGGFMDVRYSIRYPSGTFEVRQRVRKSQGGYIEAHERVKRIVSSGNKLKLLASAMRKVVPAPLLQELISYCEPLEAFLKELR